MDVIRYTEDIREEWEEFVENSNNGTIFHLQRFLDYHPMGRFMSHHLVFRKKGKLVAVWPAVEKLGGSGRQLISHAGASYGGFVVREDLSIRDAVLLVESLVQYASKEGFGSIVLTQPPLIYYRLPNNYLDFALIKCGFEYLKRELTSVISLNYREGDILSTFKNEARTALRKAQRSGVEVAKSDDLKGFYEILTQNLKMRHNVNPTHSLDELFRLKELLPKRIKQFSAYLGDKQIAGMMLFICNPKVVLAFYISHKEEYQRYRAVNFLFYEVIRWAVEQGFEFLDLGTFTLNMVPNWGLGRFKENFGARGYFRDTFEKRL
ncbi:MAG TPA: GNAT family N-acetyltransferase [Candidatus Latescibacteria bacterium]|nr:GNAT family N-acetyltransferase [Candidatus Latescibacterota bacterium]